MNYLFSRKEEGRVITTPIAASDYDVRMFSAGKHDGPGAAQGKFAIDMSAHKSKWNHRASEVFARSFVQLQSGYKEQEQEVANKFLSHIRTIFVHFNDRVLGKKQNKPLETLNRRRKRKSTVL